MILVLFAIFAALLLSSKQIFGSSAESVYDTCVEEVGDDSAATLSADKNSVDFSTGSYIDSSDVSMQDCLLRETGAPGAVETRIGNTRALDGTQESSWDGWSAFWTYHPDNGLDITFSVD